MKILGDLLISRTGGMSSEKIDYTPRTVANSTVTLDQTTTTTHIFTGSTVGQIVNMGNATNRLNGWRYELINTSTTPIAISYNDSSAFFTLNPQATAHIMLTDNTSSNGVWYYTLNTQVPVQYASTTSTSAISTSSSTFSNVTGLDITPQAGTYIVFFHTGIENTTANGEGEYAIAIDTTNVTDSVRPIQILTTILGLITLTVNAIAAGVATATLVTVNGSQVIRPRYRAVSGTIQISNRSLILLKVI